MVASTLGGFFYLEWWFALLVGIVLSAISLDKNLVFARDNTDVGVARVLAA